MFFSYFSVTFDLHDQYDLNTIKYDQIRTNTNTVSTNTNMSQKIKARMGTLRVGNSLDKCTDMGPLVDQRQYDDVMHHINAARAEGAVVYQAVSEDQLPKRPDGSKGLWVRELLMSIDDTCWWWSSYILDLESLDLEITSNTDHTMKKQAWITLHVESKHVV
jgi:hypothetical protein